MAEFHGDLSKLLILVLLVICTKNVHAEFESNNETAGINLIDFEQIKYNLFNSNIVVEFKDKKLKPNDRKCLRELEAIRKGLDRSDLWALKSKFLIFRFDINQ